MAYNRNNRVGGGCHDDDAGLTAYGRRVLDEMARVGIVACCTHTGHRTAMDVMAHSSRPVIFSHSNPRAMHDHPRNIPDEAMKACAATGGVVGLNGIGIFLGDNDNSTETLVRHLDYAVQLIGPEHVGLGLDYVFDQVELDDYVTKMAATFPKGMGYDKGIRMVAPEQVDGRTLAAAGLLRCGACRHPGRQSDAGGTAGVVRRRLNTTAATCDLT